MKSFGNKKLIIITSIVISLVLILFLFYNLFTEKREPALRAIPSNAALIIVTQSPHETWQKLSENNIWKELLGIKNFTQLNDEIEFIDSVIKNNIKVGRIINKNELYISLHQVSLVKYDYLFSISLNIEGQKVFIQKLIGELSSDKSAFIQRRYNGVRIYSVIIKNYEKVFSYAIYKGVFIVSFAPSLVEKAIDQLNTKDDLSKNQSLKLLSSSAGKKVNANIYINYKNFSAYLKQFALKGKLSGQSDIASFIEWTELDVLIKKDKILFTGYSTIHPENEYFLQLFANQPPYNHKLIDYFPENTSVFTIYSFYNYTRFIKDYNKYLKRKYNINTFDVRMKELDKKYNINFEKSFSDIIGKEVALVITSFPENKNQKENTYAFIHTNDSSNNSATFPELSNVVMKLTGAEAETRDYLGYQIGKLNVPGLLTLFFGNLFSEIFGNYFTTINNVIIVGNSLDAIKNYINYYNSNKLLKNTNSYKQFSENIDDNSNLFFYCNIANSETFIDNQLNKIYKIKYNENAQVFSNISGISVQYKSSGKLFYTNVCIKYKGDEQSEFAAEWELPLESGIISAPVIINSGKEKKIAIVDFSNVLYLIDEQGVIDWKIKLKEKPLSNINEIKIKNENYIVFNTENYLYLIGMDGKFKENMPLKLKARTTCPLQLIQNKKEISVLIGGNNKLIYDYLINGTINKNWETPKVKSIIRAINYYNIKGRVYIVFVDNVGNIYITDANGKQLNFYSQIIGTSKDTKVFPNLTNSKSLFLCNDSIGSIIYLLKDGTVEKNKLTEISSDFDFAYEDFNGDKINEFIYFRQGKFTVFNQNGKVLFEQVFPDEFFSNILTFKRTPLHIIFGITNKDNNNLYLLSNNGIINSNVNIIGDTPFTLQIEDENIYSIYTGNKNKLLNYLIK